MIRSTKHYFIKYLNRKKSSLIEEVISDYCLMVQKYINIIWNDYKKRGWNILSSDICNRISSQSSNNSRLRQAAGKQACSTVNSVFSKQNKRIYMMNKLRKEGKEFKYLQRIIDRFQPKRPSASRINPILDSRFFDIRESKKGHFDLFIRLSSLGNKREIIIPIKHHKQSRKWLSQGVLKKSIAINKKYITFFYEIPDVPKRKDGIFVGADQGMNTCLTLSDGQTTKRDKNHYDLKNICEKLSRKNPVPNPLQGPPHTERTTSTGH
jgi:transposase